MKFKYLIIYIFYFSFSNQSFAQKVGFEPLGSSYKNELNSKIHEIQNMPKFKSQDSLGLCYAFSAHTLFQYEICKEKKITCRNVELKDEASVLRIAAWAHPDDPSENYANPAYRRSIKFGGSATNALFALSASTDKGEFSMQSEQCFEIDNFANGIGKDLKKTNELLETLETEYNKFKKTEADFCITCLAQKIKTDLGIHYDDIALKSKLNVPNFSRFLYSIILSRCRDLTKFKIGSKFVRYSEVEKSDLSYNSVVEKIKEVIISKQKPLVVDGICMELNRDGVCTGDHSTVISGYKRMCNSSGCRDVFKIHNSYGEAWQNATDGGWVDAQTMLNPKYSKVSLGWFE